MRYENVGTSFFRFVTFER